MKRQTAVTTPLFIPDDIIAAYLDDARWQVEMSWAGRRAAGQLATAHPAPQRTSRLARVTKPQRVALAIVVTLALTALGVLAARWTMLAVETGETLWTALCFGGGALWVVATAVALSFRFPPVAPR